MITAIVTSCLLIALFAIIEAYDDVRDIKQSITIRHGQSFIVRVMVALLFSFLAHAYNFDLWKIIILAIAQGGVFGIVFTLMLNSMLGRHPLEIGTTTGSGFDKFFNKCFGNQSAGLMEIIFFTLVSGLAITYYVLK